MQFLGKIGLMVDGRRSSSSIGIGAPVWEILYLPLITTETVETLLLYLQLKTVLLGSRIVTPVPLLRPDKRYQPTEYRTTTRFYRL